jgi:class 3 adenylate cyclase
MKEPNIQYTTTEDGAGIAYAIVGTGYPLVRMNPIVTSFSYSWDDPAGGLILRQLSENCQLIHFDGRGSGLSQRDAQDFSLEARVKDREAVVQATGHERLALYGFEWSVPVAVAYAVRNPDIVTHLILEGGFARAVDVATWEQLKAIIDLSRNNWKLGARTLAHLAHSAREADETLPKRLTDSFLESISGEGMAEWFTEAYKLDVTELLPRLKMPALVLHARGDRVVRFSLGQQLAARIPNARFVALQGDAAPIGEQQSMARIAPILDFLEVDGELRSRSARSPSANALRTVLFTDLVGHTEMMSRLGDERGRAVLREHERITREVLKANGGTEVKTMGDGFMASFGSVTKAVACAIALQRAFADRDGEPLSVRVGLNAGEPIEEDGDLFGATVILASRIAAKAGSGEILVADTVRGLCSGKGFLFADRGEFVAKGFEEPVRVCEVSWRASSQMA